MALKTTLEQIEELQTAISKVLKSQEYQTGDSRNKRALLSELTAREKELLDRYYNEQAAGDMDAYAQFNLPGAGI
jgi:FixJ family two-component response regulator